MIPRRRRAPTPVLDGLRRARFEAAFAEVYEPLQRYVRRRAAPHVVDDVVAEALVVLWRRLDEVAPDDLLPWCYGVARRCLANHRRAEDRSRRLHDRLAAAAAVSPDDDDSADPALDAALALLSADDREIVRLWAWEGLAPRKIAGAMAMSANAVSIRLHRAKRSMAAALSTPSAPGGKNGDGGGHRAGGATPLAPKEAR